MDLIALQQARHPDLLSWRNMSDHLMTGLCLHSEQFLWKSAYHASAHSLHDGSPFFPSNWLKIQGPSLVRATECSKWAL